LSSPAEITLAANSTLEKELLTEAPAPHLDRGQKSLLISRMEGNDTEKSPCSAFAGYLMLLQIFLQVKNILQSSCNHLPPVLQEILFITAQVKPQAGV